MPSAATATAPPTTANPRTPSEKEENKKKKMVYCILDLVHFEEKRSSCGLKKKKEAEIKTKKKNEKRIIKRGILCML